MRSRIPRRGAVLTAAALATMGMAATQASAALPGLPPGQQVNDDAPAGIDPGRNAGLSDVVGGSLAAGGVRVPWATFEQQTAGEQQVFVRAFKDGQWRTQGSPASLNVDPNAEAEAPTIDFAGPGRTVPWVAWYEPWNGGATNIFASRFDAGVKRWIPDPSLNIHADRDAENPAVVGGATVAGNAPVPWVAWQERDGGADNDSSPEQIFVSRRGPGGFTPTGIKRIKKDAATSVGATDPTLNVDPTRDGVNPDMAFTGPDDVVPWVVWYEEGDSKIDLRDNQQVFAAKAVADASADGGFRWVAVGNGTAGKTDTLDTTGTHGFGPAAESVAAEDAASLNVAPDKDAEDPRVAAGTLTPGGIASPWVVWTEKQANGNAGIFVSRLVGGDHFELANGGKPVSAPTLNASQPDITFSGNTPYVTWHSEIGGKLRTVVGHFNDLTTFKVDGLVDPTDADVRSPISSSNTADPFTGDGATAPGNAIGTPFLLHTTDGAPQKLLAHGYQPVDVTTGDASSVTQSSAHVTGSVNPEGAAVRVHFDYGQSTAYGSRTADQRIGAFSTPQTFAADITALPEYTAIHYRSVVESDFGTFYGPDRVFVTGVRAPGPPYGGGGNPYPPYKPGHKPHKKHKKHWPRIDTKVLKLRADGTVAVKMTCPAAHGPRCTGTLRVKYHNKVIGRTAFVVKGGKSKALTIKVIKKYRSTTSRAAAQATKGIKVKVSAGTTSTTLRLRIA